jgi:hypothetical protein
MTAKETIPMKLQSTDVDLDGLPIDDVIEKLREASEGLTNPRLDIEYGDSYLRMEVNGMVPKTDEDILTEMAEAARRQKVKRSHVLGSIHQWAKEEELLELMRAALKDAEDEEAP